MTGTGTQNDPYIVTTWDELATYVETDGAYIALSANSTWDINDWYTSSVPELKLYCNEINLNGSVIRNLRKSSGSLFRLFASHDVDIKNGTISNMYLSNAVLFDVGGYNDKAIQLTNIKLSGELYKSKFFDCNASDGVSFDTCAVSVHLANSTFSGQGGGWVRKSFINSTIFLEGTVSDHVGTINLDSSALYGNLTTISEYNHNLFLNNDTSVIDITLNGFDNIYSDSSAASVINISTIGNASVSGANMIQATSAQIADASWLRAQGFPVA